MQQQTNATQAIVNTNYYINGRYNKINITSFFDLRYDRAARNAP